MGKVFDSEPGAVVVPNPGLEAEYAYNGDLNITKIFSERLKIDLSGYYTLLQNAMVRRDFSLNGQDSIWYDGTLSKVQAIQNASLAKVYGFQASVEIKFPGGFGFSSDLNYQKGIEELDDGTTSPSRHAPPLFGTSRLIYRTNKLTVQLYTVFNGGMTFEQLPESEKGKAYIYAADENGNPHAPSWYTINLKLMYDAVENLNITAGVENILDRRYRPYSSGIAAPGRNIIMAVKYKF
jgi:hemoglobin/transferrin/lactoferrin receptor protein